MHENDVITTFDENGQHQFVLSFQKTPNGYLYQIEELADDGELIQGFRFMNGEIVAEEEEEEDEL
jgi:hypothetical protein